MRTRYALPVLVLLLGPTGPRPQRAAASDLSGSWGGEHIGLIVMPGGRTGGR